MASPATIVSDCAPVRMAEFASGQSARLRSHHLGLGQQRRMGAGHVRFARTQLCASVENTRPRAYPTGVIKSIQQSNIIAGPTRNYDGTAGLFDPHSIRRHERSRSEARCIYSCKAFRSARQGAQEHRLKVPGESSAPVRNQPSAKVPALLSSGRQSRPGRRPNRGRTKR